MNDIPFSTFLITGACGDIGQALAAEFAAGGRARLALCDLQPPPDADRRFDNLRRAGAHVLYRRVDVADAAEVQRFTLEVEQAFGGIDVCIGNAGIVERGGLRELPPDAWRRTIDVNLTGCFHTAQAAAGAMARAGRGGQILFIGSWVQDVPRAGIGAYCVSKAGLAMLAKCLALELGPDNIRVNVVAPGFVDAGLTGRNLRDHPGRRASVEAEVPLGRLVTADEVARAVRMLCSPDASYVTGTTLLIDGGSSLSYRRPGPSPDSAGARSACD